MNKKRWIIILVTLAIIGFVIGFCVGLQDSEEKKDTGSNESTEISLDENVDDADEDDSTTEKKDASKKSTTSTDGKDETPMQPVDADAEDGKGSGKQESSDNQDSDVSGDIPTEEQKDNSELPFVPFD